MKKPLYDHGFTKIPEGHPDFAPHFITAKLREIDELYTKIAAVEGSFAADNVIEPKFIKRALERCLKYFTDQSDDTWEDYLIFARYAANAAKEIDRVIDAELGHLGL